MAKLGFLGLGIMGYPMARNLARAGHEVSVWSHTGEKAERLAREEKATACKSPKEVAERSECVFACVGDSDMSEQVLTGEDGVLGGAKSGTVVADCSTVSMESSRRVRARIEAKGVAFLDAPCTGSKPGAENAALTFMVGGEKAVYDRAQPWFQPMGKQFFYCGAAGMGLQAKLTQNLILSNILMAFNEGMVLSTKAGVDPELMLEVLNNSAAKSGLMTFKAPFVLNRDFTTNFSTKWMHKDVSLALASGLEQGVPLPLTGTAQQMFRAAIAMGYGEDDMCSTIKVLESWAGVEVKKR